MAATLTTLDEGDTVGRITKTGASHRHGLREQPAARRLDVTGAGAMPDRT